MEFYQLRYFAKAAAYENISMAAQDLHVTQPSISKAVKALEKELQVELMRRNGKYCELTHEGRLLQARILPVLAELNDIPAEIQNRQSRQQIRLNVLSASFLIPDLIRKFRASHGDVFFRRDSRLAEKKRITLSDLSNEDFIALKEGGSLREISDKRFQELGFIPQVAYECDNHCILKRMVEEGLGVAIWTEYSWRRQLEREEENPYVCLRPLDIPNFTRSLYLIRQKDIKMTREMEDFLKFTEGYFSAVHK